MNSKEEDIYKFLKEFHPETNKKGDYSIDEISELYEIAKKTHVGEFTTGDFLTYNYKLQYEDDIYTAVVIFEKHKRNEKGESDLSIDSDLNKSYMFKTYCYCLNVFDVNEISKVELGNKAISIAYTSSLRYSNQEEKIALLNKIKKGLIDV
jgi:hypothetical protein